MRAVGGAQDAAGGADDHGGSRRRTRRRGCTCRSPRPASSWPPKTPARNIVRALFPSSHTRCHALSVVAESCESRAGTRPSRCFRGQGRHPEVPVHSSTCHDAPAPPCYSPIVGRGWRLCSGSVPTCASCGAPALQERLRQQIEEIKEQEANYDADAALAMAMFEHSEVRPPRMVSWKRSPCLPACMRRTCGCRMFRWLRIRPMQTLAGILR